MVVTPAVIVPDQASWTMWGRDPGRLGFEPAATPEQARRLLVPDPVPAALIDAVLAAWRRMPPPRRYVSWPRQLAGAPAAELLTDDLLRGGDAEQAANGEEEMHGGHGAGDSHDHHDMMAVVGDPSADGLVMEPIEFALGPLAAGLPGGLVLDLALDGDVVESCEVRATLTMPLGPIAGGACVDPTASAAWTAAIALASERAAGTPTSEAMSRLRIAAVEAERALSHLSWLRALGLVLGWAELGERADRAVEPLTPLRAMLERAAATPGPRDRHEDLAGGLDRSRRPVERVLGLLDGSRRLRSRTRKRAATPPERLAALGLEGPIARAAGVGGDARADEPLYQALGFSETRLAEGDAEARTLLRASEAMSALQLAAAALAEPGSQEPVPGGPATEAFVEGPRGPVRAAFADGRLEVGAPGAARLHDVAGEAVTGLEVGSALAGIASFDLSGWRVSG